MKLKIKNFLKKHWIGCWAILSVIFAIVIHFLFSLTAPCKSLVAKWGAGDILTYTSTIALGLLAMWQNKKLKEENDIAQDRLENISKHSNEINIISKIIEYETNRLHSLEKAMDDFVEACNPQTMAIILSKDVDNNFLAINELTEHEIKIDTLFLEIGRLLRVDHEVRHNDEHPLNKSFAVLYVGEKEIIDSFRNNKLNFLNQGDIIRKIDSLGKCRDIFLQEREQYLIRQENKLSRILFEDLSLEEIRNLYKK